MNVNIISIDQDEKKTRYFYDSCNRLIREDSPNFKKSTFFDLEFIKKKELKKRLKLFL